MILPHVYIVIAPYHTLKKIWFFMLNFVQALNVFAETRVIFATAVITLLIIDNTCSDTFVVTLVINHINANIASTHQHQSTTLRHMQSADIPKIIMKSLELTLKCLNKTLILNLSNYLCGLN